MKCPRRQPDSGRDRHPHRKRQRQRRHQARGIAHDREPLRKRFDESGQHARQPRRQHAFDRAAPRGRAVPDARPARTARPGRRPPTPPRSRRRTSRRRAAPGSPEITPGRRVKTKTANSSSTVARSSTRSRMMVANADVGIQRLAPRQQIRAQHLADSCRDQGVGGKADHRRVERDRVPCRSDWRQERLPSPGANRVRQAGHDSARIEQAGIGAAGLGPDGGRSRPCGRKTQAARW